MALAWLSKLFAMVDGLLEKLFASLRKLVRILKLARFLLLLLILGGLALAVCVIIYPFIIPYVVAASILLGGIPLIAIRKVLGIPLKQKSFIRLVKQGHRKSSKELAIRVAARKLHEESIETEELLVETAVNEGRKAVKKYRKKAESLRSKLDELEDSEADSDDETESRGQKGS